MSTENYPGKPGPKPGVTRELRTDIERLFFKLNEQKIRIDELEVALAKGGFSPKPPPLTIESLAQQIFVARAANLKLEGFPAEAFTDMKAQVAVNQFWFLLRDHSLLAAAAFFSEAEPRPAAGAPELAEEIKPAPIPNPES